MNAPLSVHALSAVLVFAALMVMIQTLSQFEKGVVMTDPL
jgi:hypothetical protein